MTIELKNHDWLKWRNYCSKDDSPAYKVETKTWNEDYDVLLNDVKKGVPRAMKMFFKFKAGL